MMVVVLPQLVVILIATNPTYPAVNRSTKFRPRLLAKSKFGVEGRYSSIQ